MYLAPESVDCSDEAEDRIRVTNRVWTRAVGWGRLGECQDFWAAFQAVGVNSATRLAGQSPNRGSTSLRY